MEGAGKPSFGERFKARIGIRGRSKSPNPATSASLLASADTSADASPKPSTPKDATSKILAGHQGTPDVATAPKLGVLWQEAFRALQTDPEKSQALTEFQHHILSNTPAEGAQSGQISKELSEAKASPMFDETWRDILKQYADSTRERMAGHVRGDERIAKILDTITVAKDTLAFAASFEPHAAVVWTGVASILPVKNPPL